MPGVLHNATLADLPANSLPLLGPWRGAPGVRVLLAAGRAWVRWEVADPSIVQALLPAPEVRFYERRDERWFACGSRLPVHDLPEGEFAPLGTMLLPGRVHIAPAPGGALSPVKFTIERDAQPRACTALVCTPVALAQWVALAPDTEVASFTACRSGELVLLMGERPPLLPGCERFWGSRLLLPLGWRASPDLPEQALCEAAGAGAGEMVLWRGGAIIVARACMAPLTRASARLGARHGP